MATVTITIPDALVPRLVTAARARFPQYAALTDAAAFRAISADHWRQLVAGYEAEQSATAQNAQTLADLTGIG